MGDVRVLEERTRANGNRHPQPDEPEAARHERVERLAQHRTRCMCRVVLRGPAGEDERGLPHGCLRVVPPVRPEDDYARAEEFPRPRA